MTKTTPDPYLPGAVNLKVRPLQKTEKIYSDDGVLLYDGSTLGGKPYGPGTAYWPDGTVYQEGIFDVKGLVCGREYYPTGILRFEGAYRICHGYGPNYPRYGSCFDENGKRYFDSYFDGPLKYSFDAGIGYPHVEEPKQFDSVIQENIPRIPSFSWEDGRQYGIMIRIENTDEGGTGNVVNNERKAKCHGSIVIPTYEEYEARLHDLWVNKYGTGSREQNEKDFYSEDGQRYVKRGYGSAIAAALAYGGEVLDESILNTAVLASMCMEFC